MSEMPRRFSRRFPGYGWAWPRGPLDQLLKAALLLDEAAALANASAWLDRHDIDTATFRDHRLLAAVSQRFGSALAGHAAYPRLVGLRRHLWTRSRMAAREAEPALAAISAAGVRMMLIKGASRVALDASAEQGRVAHDIDIVVPPADLLAAFRILTETGWMPSTGSSPHYVQTQLPSLRALNFFAGSFGAIDLHQAAYPGDQDEGDERRVWVAAEAAEFHGLAALVPSAADRAAMAIAYGALDAHVHSDWLIDCVIAIQSARFSWDAFVELSIRRRLPAATVIALSYLSQELGLPVPAAVLGSIAAAADSEGLRRVGVLLQAKPRTDMGRLLNAVRWLAKRRRLNRERSSRAANPQPVYFGKRAFGIASPASHSETELATAHRLDLPDAALGGRPAVVSLLVKIAVPSVFRRIELEINGTAQHVARLRYRKRWQRAGFLLLHFEVGVPPELSDQPLAIEARPNRQLRRTASPEEVTRHGALPFRIVSCTACQG
jgi:hypothetical protein